MARGCLICHPSISIHLSPFQAMPIDAPTFRRSAPFCLAALSSSMQRLALHLTVLRPLGPPPVALKRIHSAMILVFSALPSIILCIPPPMAPLLSHPSVAVAEVNTTGSLISSPKIFPVLSPRLTYPPLPSRLRIRPPLPLPNFLLSRDRRPLPIPALRALTIAEGA